MRKQKEVVAVCPISSSSLVGHQHDLNPPLALPTQPFSTAAAMVAPTPSASSSLARQVSGLLLSSTSRTALTRSALPSTSANLLNVRHSHVGSTPLDLPPSTTIEILPFPPHPNPSRPLLPSLRHAKSVLVKGPKGEVVVPLHDCVVLSQPSSSSSSAAEDSSRITLAIKDESEKKQRGTWGLTRSLLHNALTGVSEGHTVSLKLVGVGYRASIEADPLPRRPNSTLPFRPQNRSF